MGPGMLIVIFVAVMAMVIVLGAASKLLEGMPPPWRALHDLYPAQSPTPAPGSKEARFFILDAANPRPRMVRVRYTTDDDSFDIWPVSARNGKAMGVSIPWAGAQLGRPAPTPIGPHVSVAIDGIKVLVPATAVQKELELRAALETADPPPHDPLVEEIS